MASVTQREYPRRASTPLPPDLEPDEDWKRDLGLRIEVGLRPMVDEARQKITDELAKGAVGPEEQERLAVSHLSTLRTIRQLGEEQFRITLERERQERRWASGEQLDRTWSESLLKEQQAILDRIERPPHSPLPPPSPVQFQSTPDQPLESPTPTTFPSGRKIAKPSFRHANLRERMLSVTARSGFVVPEIWKPSITPEEDARLSRTYTLARGSTSASQTTLSEAPSVHDAKFTDSCVAPSSGDRNPSHEQSSSRAADEERPGPRIDVSMIRPLIPSASSRPTVSKRSFATEDAVPSRSDDSSRGWGSEAWRKVVLARRSSIVSTASEVQAPSVFSVALTDPLEALLDDNSGGSGNGSVDRETVHSADRDYSEDGSDNEDGSWRSRGYVERRIQTIEEWLRQREGELMRMAEELAWEAEELKREKEVRRKRAAEQKREEARRSEEQSKQIDANGADSTEAELGRKEEKVDQRESNVVVLEEARRLAEETTRKEEEEKIREMEVKRKEEDARKKVEEVKRIEREVRRKEEEARRKEKEAGRMYEEAMRTQEEARRKEEELCRRMEELGRREEDLNRREAEMHRLEGDKRQEGTPSPGRPTSTIPQHQTLVRRAIDAAMQLEKEQLNRLQKERRRQ